MPKAVLLSIMLFFCSGAIAANIEAGKPVPPFSIKTLDGKTITPADSKGRVLVINLWATWCEPCRTEMPALDTLYKKYHAQGVDVVAVSLDDMSDISKVKQFAGAFTFPAAMLTEADLKSFGRIWRVPVTFIIDQNGIVRRNGWKGDPLVDEAILEKTVAPLLAPQ